jgi:glyoxylase-like metal-dependent hydrolase (beta-lactamase superfamily II)
MGTLLVDKSTLTLGIGFGNEMEIPIWAAAIEGNEKRIIVDTGISNHQWVEENVAPCTQKEDEKIDVAIQALGWNVRDVDVVINTHLHYDHCQSNKLFNNSKFFVNPIEWEYAKNPVATQEIFYDRTWLAGDITYFHYNFCSDHYEISPGLRIIRTPGHTPGHQSVLVNSEEGVVAITGDAMNMPENLNENSPPGILHDTTAALNSIRRIKSYADRIITGHDPKIEHYQDHSFPVTK